MKDPTFRLVELSGNSTTSIEDAVARAIQSAHDSIKNLSWFQVIEMLGPIHLGKMNHWLVTIKVGLAVLG